MLVFEHVTKRFGQVVAVNDATLTVEPGIVTSVIGPNGAGKSTLVNMAAGSYAVSAGRILLDGVELQRLPKHRIHQAGLSRTYQNIRLFDGMTVLQNLEVALTPTTARGILAETFLPRAAGLRDERRDRSMAVLDRLGIRRHADREAGDLAYGEQKLVELARAIVCDPKAILLDEPAAGLNHGETDLLKHHILALRQPGVALVLIEHDMKLIMSVSDRIIVMNQGAVLAEGTPAQIRENTQVQEAYLGQPGAIHAIEAAAQGRKNRVRIRSGEGLAWH
ncbi:ABC transporter ATP-binding protein [Aureimonas altamirensis]|uniref:ABC transporter ATP-binding protein n=1 Tax=Aureimonas altamirensis TaxID=370622 RepID=UPI00255265C0|nr:ABC transporter ATP-binding protein [Aureimonas altamirensis]